MGEKISKPTIIRIRKGLNGYPVSACNSKGKFINNFESIEQLKEYYAYEIHHKLVQIKKETGKYPEDILPKEK